jgi:predicted nuclease with TOPRIM domain
VFFKSKDYAKFADSIMRDEEKTNASRGSKKQASAPRVNLEKLSGQATKQGTRYTIDDAINLFNNLAEHDNHLVIDVASIALQSAGVNLKVLNADAQKRLSNLNSEMRRLNEEIKMRQAQIENLRNRVGETSNVKEKLGMVLTHKRTSKEKQEIAKSCSLTSPEFVT